MTFKIIYSDLIEAFEVKTEGNMDAGDFIAMARALLQDPCFLPNYNVLFDHTSLDFNEMSLDDLQKIRTFHNNNEENIGGGKSAIVVKRGLLGEWHRLWSKGKKIKTRNKVKVFENYDDAVKWILG